MSQNATPNRCKFFAVSSGILMEEDSLLRMNLFFPSVDLAAMSDYMNSYGFFRIVDRIKHTPVTNNQFIHTLKFTSQRLRYDDI